MKTISQVKAEREARRVGHRQNPLADLFHDARTAHSLSQQDVSSGTGLSTGTVSLYETGKITPNLHNGLVLARFLEIDLNTLADAAIQTKEARL